MRAHDRRYRGHTPKARSLSAALALCTMGALLPGVLSCSRGSLASYVPARPHVGMDGRDVHPVPVFTEAFPERHLEALHQQIPTRTLARLEAMFRDMPVAETSEPAWSRDEIDAEVAQIQAAIDSLGIGGGSLMRQRLGRNRPEEQEKFRQAALLYARWGIAWMRMDEVNHRVWAQEKIRQASDWDPDNPILALVLARGLEIGGFWSEGQRALDAFARGNGPSDLIDLQRLRRTERTWKVTRFHEDLQSALEIWESMAARHGGPDGCPAWLRMERARLLHLANSLREAEREALSVIALASAPPSDTMAMAEAELLLGVIEVRRLEYEAAAPRFERVLRLAETYPDLAGIASWMIVPWDLFTNDERMEYDKLTDPLPWVSSYWDHRDPIWATPTLRENRIEYWRRVGEAWFALSGIEPGRPGPLTEPGQALLRFGLPHDWNATVGESAAGYGSTRLDYGINRTWRFNYRFRNDTQETPFTIVFQDRGSSSRFSSADSLRGRRYPPFAFDDRFAGLGYRLDTAIARFRQSDGKIRLVLSWDTYLPDYSVRYPMQGLRYEGQAEVLSTVYQSRGRAWYPGSQVRLNLDHEWTLPREWILRRRAGTASVAGLDPATVRIASQLLLRDTRGRIVAMAVDNGREGRLTGFHAHHLDASDLLLVELGDSSPEESDRVLRPGLVVHGPDPDTAGFLPRAGRTFLPGEDLAYYMEVYNIHTGQGVTDVELTTTLESLSKDGKVDYSVTLRGTTQGLIRFGINQWNVARSLGLGDLKSGSYRLRVSIFDRHASRRLERSAEFRVMAPAELVALYNWAELRAPER